MSSLTHLLLQSGGLETFAGHVDHPGHAVPGSFRQVLPRPCIAKSSSSFARTDSPHRERLERGVSHSEEEDSGGLPVISAAKLRELQGHTSQSPALGAHQQGHTLGGFSDIEDDSAAFPSLRELLNTLDIAECEPSSIAMAGVCVDKPPEKQIGPVEEFGGSVAEAAQLSPDAPTWSFMKANIVGSQELDSSRIQAYENSFEEVEKSALRAPAKQAALKAKWPPNIDKQPINLVDQRLPKLEHWEGEAHRDLPMTGPKLMACQLGIDKDKAKGKGKGKTKSTLGEKRIAVAPRTVQQRSSRGVPGQGQQFPWDESLPWEEPLPQESGSRRLQQIREQLLPQPRPGQDRSEEGLWQLSGPTFEGHEAGQATRHHTTETLPGTRGLRKPGAQRLFGRNVGLGLEKRQLSNSSASPLEEIPLRCNNCHETTYCSVECSRKDCWKIEWKTP